MTRTEDRAQIEPGSLPERMAAAFPVPAMDAWAPMLSGMQAWNDRYTATVGAFSNEWMSFAQRRLTQDLAFPQALAECRGLDEMWRVYARFVQQMADDYQTEFRELARIGSSLAEGSMRAVQKGSGPAVRQ